MREMSPGGSGRSHPKSYRLNTTKTRHNQKEMVGNGEKQNGGKKDKNFVHKYQIMGRKNPSSKDKSTKNFMCVTENAKEFPEQGFLQDVRKF